jgi:hypothetical protein
MRLGYAFVSDRDPPSNVQVDPTSELTRSPPGHSDRGAVLGARSSRGPRAAVAPTPRHTPRSAPLDRILVAGCALRVPVTTHSLNAKARFSRCFYLRSAVQPFPSLQELLRRHLGGFWSRLIMREWKLFEPVECPLFRLPDSAATMPHVTESRAGLGWRCWWAVGARLH